MKSINILGYEHYLVDSLGNVYFTRDTRGNLLKKPKLKKAFKNSRTAYYQQILRSNISTEIKAFYVHRLVAQHYLPNPHNLPCVCHKDDNPANNYLDNLFWGTHKDNMQDCIKKNRKNDQLKAIKNIYQFNENGKLLKVWSSSIEVKKEYPDWSTNKLYTNYSCKNNFWWSRFPHKNIKTKYDRQCIKRKMGAKEVLQFDIEGNFIKKYTSAMEVKRELNIHPTFCLKGKYKTAGGFVFKYSVPSH